MNVNNVLPREVPLQHHVYSPLRALMQEFVYIGEAVLCIPVSVGGVFAHMHSLRFATLVISMTLTSTAQTMTDLSKLLFSQYDRFKLHEITTRRFTQQALLGWLRPFVEQNVLAASAVGTSAEGRTITLYTYGTGQTRVLLWSQMHGDEPTATMALADMASFFFRFPDHLAAQAIRRNLTLLMVPMLNPDGAERFSRRTAQMIDMNRDALRLATPEARVLRELQETYQPEFGFNLHDQDPRYSVGNTPNVTAIALLAPPLDAEKSDSPGRRRAKQVAATLATVLNAFIPGHLARYDDTFEPRAFGDNIQRWGTSTVLVESGGWPNDREKMFLRKLKTIGLLSALYGIATHEYEHATVDVYEQLPFNGKNLYDLIIQNVQLRGSEHAPPLQVDIGINIDEVVDDATGTIRLVAKVVDIGDLSTIGAFERMDGNGIALTGEHVHLDREIPYEKIMALFRR